MFENSATKPFTRASWGEEAPSYTVEVRGGPAFEMLIGLSALAGGLEDRVGWVASIAAASDEALTMALARVGDVSGETWLHLLGIALDPPTPADGAGLIAAVEAIDPPDLRRHLLGAHVPAWRKYVDLEVIDAAAAGDAGAGARLLASDRYYAGRAADALAILLPLGGEETKDRILAVLRVFYERAFRAVEDELGAALAADVAAKRVMAKGLPDAKLIEVATDGYSYVGEPGLPRVVMIPHIAAAPGLLLCQHRSARVICYPVSRDEATEPAARLAAAGKALGDPRRLRILEELAAGPVELDELADRVGLGRSTVHHHLGLLRAGRFVRLSGNARRYRYEVNPAGVDEIGALLARFLGAAGSR